MVFGGLVCLIGFVGSVCLFVCFLIGNLISFKGELSLSTKSILLTDRALMSCSGNR